MVGGGGSARVQARAQWGTVLKNHRWKGVEPRFSLAAKSLANAHVYNEMNKTDSLA